MVQITNVTKVADKEVELKGEPKVLLTNEELKDKIMDLELQMRELIQAKAAPAAPKNHRMGKAAAGRKYVILKDRLPSWGRVPQQQADIADLLLRKLKVGEEYTEREVFDLMVDGAADYDSLWRSKQDPTYLFRYYRGLKNDSKHAGFIARGFLRQVN